MTDIDTLCTNASSKMEEDARKLGEATSDPDRAIQLSIAISLKRIADALQKPKVDVMPYIKPEQFFNQS